MVLTCVVCGIKSAEVIPNKFDDLGLKLPCCKDARGCIYRKDIAGRHSGEAKNYEWESVAHYIIGPEG